MTDTITMTPETIEKLHKLTKRKTIVDPSIQDSKAFKKYVTLTSQGMGKELLGKTPEELEKILSECDIYEHEVKAELEATPEYQSVKEKKKLLETGMKEVLAPIKAKRTVALDLLALYKADKKD